MYGVHLTVDQIGVQNPVVKKGRVKECNGGKLSNNQSNFIKGLSQRAELALQEANILDVNGRLTNFAVENSKLLLRGDKLSNPKVIEALSKSGNVEDWGKYTTTVKGKITKISNKTGNNDNPITNSIIENLEVHYYKNRITNEVCYTIDFKIKGNIDLFAKKITP